MKRGEGRGYPKTPDGRYSLHGSRLWRCSNPDLPEPERERLAEELRVAHRAVKDAYAGKQGMADARARVDLLKIKLGERGPVWWTDGAPDYNRELASKTPYAAWAKALAPPKLPLRSQS